MQVKLFRVGQELREQSKERRCKVGQDRQGKSCKIIQEQKDNLRSATQIDKQENLTSNSNYKITENNTLVT